MEENKIWQEMLLKGVLILFCVSIFSLSGIFLEKAREAVNFYEFLFIVLFFLSALIFTLMFFEEEFYDKIDLEEKESYIFLLPILLGASCLFSGFYLLSLLWDQLIISIVNLIAGIFLSGIGTIILYLVVDKDIGKILKTYVP